MSSNSLFLPERFREVAHYIHTHHGKTFVVYLSGNVLSENITLTALIQDLALIHTLGVKLVLVLDLNTLIQQDAKERDSSLSHDNRLLTHPDSIRQAHNAADEMLNNLVALFDASLVNTPLSTIKPKIAFDDFIHIEPPDFRKKKTCLTPCEIQHRKITHTKATCSEQYYRYCAACFLFNTTEVFAGRGASSNAYCKCAGE